MRRPPPLEDAPGASGADARGVTAHLIVGARPEPFLPALLASLEGVADRIVVNDTSGDAPPANRATLLASASAARGDMTLLTEPFVDFARARNACLDAHAARGFGGWIAFVDADEVLVPASAAIARNLGRVPERVNFIDGYTYHFFSSFRRYVSIERRMGFIRFSPRLRWEGAVHERLVGVDETRIALPYLYFHYGHVLGARRHAEKGRLYSRLGAAGGTLTPEEIERIDPRAYFAEDWARLLRFDGAHPPAVEALRGGIEREHAAEFAAAAAPAAASRGDLRARLERAFWRVNYDVRWRSRALNPLARRLMRP